MSTFTDSATEVWRAEASESHFLPPAEQLEEVAEHPAAERARQRRVAMRVAQDVLQRVRRPGSLRLGPILRNVQPALNQWLVRLEMKLQAVGAVSVAKRLVGTGGRAGEVDGARRQVEGVRVP